MKPEYSFLAILLQVIGSATLSAIATFLFTRKKNRAETELAQTETYSIMLKDMRESLRQQGEQILTLQNKETEYLKIINSQQSRERQLLKRVAQLEEEIKELKKAQHEYK